MTVQEYLECVECGGFIDDDGMGEAVKDGLAADYPMSEETGLPDWVKPSQGVEAIPNGPIRKTQAATRLGGASRPSLTTIGCTFLNSAEGLPPRAG